MGDFSPKLLEPEVLRAYAVIFEQPKMGIDGKLVLPSEACFAAARALRFHADALERSKEY